MPKKANRHLANPDSVLPDAASTSVDHDAISALAYEFWLERGSPIGSPEVDWFRAEKSLRRRAELLRTRTEELSQNRMESTTKSEHAVATASGR